MYPDLRTAGIAFESQVGLAIRPNVTNTYESEENQSKPNPIINKNESETPKDKPAKSIVYYLVKSAVF